MLNIHKQENMTELDRNWFSDLVHKVELIFDIICNIVKKRSFIVINSEAGGMILWETLFLYQAKKNYFRSPIFMSSVQK